MKEVVNSFRYYIAKCCTEKSCNKCHSIGDAIVVNRGAHYNLYCEKCGAFIKHANIDDKRYIYLASIKIDDLTPVKVRMLYGASSKTMTTKK